MPAFFKPQLYPTAEDRSVAMFQTKWLGMRYVNDDSELQFCLYRYNDRRRILLVVGIILGVALLFVAYFSDLDRNAPYLHNANYGTAIFVFLITAVIGLWILVDPQSVLSVTQLKPLHALVVAESASNRFATTSTTMTSRSGASNDLIPGCLRAAVYS